MVLLARVAASLVVVVLLVVFGARLARRAGLPRRGTAIQVRERVPLSRDAFLAVVEVADRGLLLGVGPQGVRVLSELDAQTLARSYPEPAGPAAGRRPSPRRPRRDHDEVTSVEVGPDGVRVTRIPDGAAPRPRGTGSVLDPRTWRQALEAFRDLTARRR